MLLSLALYLPLYVAYSLFIPLSLSLLIMLPVLYLALSSFLPCKSQPATCATAACCNYASAAKSNAAVATRTRPFVAWLTILVGNARRRISPSLSLSLYLTCLLSLSLLCVAWLTHFRHRFHECAASSPF